MKTNVSCRPPHRALPVEPFHVAEQFTGMAGKYVKLADTIRSFEAVLSGEYDHSESAFMYVGTIEEVVVPNP